MAANNKQPEMLRIEVDEICEFSTSKAIAVKCEGKTLWIPRSQLHDIGHEGKQALIWVTPYIAKEKGLI